MAEFRGTRRFETLRRLGEGATGVVWEAIDRERSARVALKTLTHLDAATLYRFKREFRSLADVVHPNLVRLHELFCEDDNWFFTMELISGDNFLDFVRPHEKHSQEATTQTERPPSVRPPPDASAARTGVDLDKLRNAIGQLVDGVAAIHDAGMLHRDIKPTNVLVAGDGRVRIVDFGIATDLRGRSGETSNESILGTPAYMAPEQAAGLPLTPAADWYAVGVVLFRAITGRAPFLGEPLDVLLQKQRFDPPRPRELGIDAPADLDDLCAALLRRRPEERPTRASIIRTLQRAASPIASSESSSRQPATPFVGRSEPLAVLDAAFEASRSGGAELVVVRGHAGIGKSTLIRRFLDSIADRAVVLVGRCYERESMPYKAFDSIVDALSRDLAARKPQELEGLLPRDVATLARLFPVLGRVPAIADAPRRSMVSDAQQLRMRAFEALREMLGRMADRSPLVLFIDDLQWGDADSVVLLRELIAPPNPPAMLVVIAHRRDDATSEAVATLRDHIESKAHPTHTIDLDGLDRDDAAALASRLLGAAAGSAAVQQIVDEAGGNPFFVAEMARYARNPHAPAQPTGARLEDVLGYRVRELPAHALRLLEVITIAGRPIRVDLALMAAGLDAETGAQAVVLLRNGHFARTGAAAAPTVEPYHDRVRETLLETIGEDRSMTIHGALADAMRAKGEIDPETLFVHLRGAGRERSAAEYARAAADKAAGALAFDRAAEFFRAALDLIAESEPEVPLLREQLGDALANAGRGVEAAAAYEAAAARVTSEAHQLELRRRAASQLLMTGHVDRGLDSLARVLAAIGLTLPATPRRALIIMLFLRAWLFVRGFGFTRREAGSVAPAVLQRIDVCWSVTAGLGVGDTLRAGMFQTRSTLMSLDAGEPIRIARALAFESSFIASRGTDSAYRRSLRAIAIAEQLAETVDDPETSVRVLGFRGLGAYVTGRFLIARERLDEAVARAQEQCVGLVWEVGSMRSFGLSALVFLGELEELSRRYPAFMRDADERGDLYFGTNLRVGLGTVTFLIRDEPGSGRETVENAIRGWTSRSFQTQHFYALQSLSLMDLYEGQTQRAHARVEERWPALRGSMLLHLQVVRGMGTYVRGACAIASARGDRPRLACARACARSLSRERRPWSEPLAAALRGGIAASLGDREGASRELRDAVVGFEAANMGTHALAARAALGTLVGGTKRAEALAELERRGVRNPAKFARAFVALPELYES